LELVEPLIFLLLVADVGPYRLLVPSDRIDEVPPGPEVLAHEVALPFAVHTGEVDRALALDENPTTCDTAYFGGIEINMCT
jgi:hypothetical protein